MNGLPYYKAYPRDFVEGTIGMSFELKGAYRLVLDLIYMQDGKLPDDARYIAGLLGCSIRKWRSLRDQLVELDKVIVSDGFLSNYRVEKELQTTRSFQQKQSENRSRPNKNNEVATPPSDHTEPDTDTERKKKRARENALAGSFEEFWNLWPHKVGKPAARKAWPRALASAGSVDVINAGVRRYISGKPPDRNWLNPSTFLNQERWNDEPAMSGNGTGESVELPKWKGPDEDRERKAQGVFREGNGLHQGQEGDGLGSLRSDPPGDSGMERMGRLLS